MLFSILFLLLSLVESPVYGLAITTTPNPLVAKAIRDSHSISTTHTAYLPLLNRPSAEPPSGEWAVSTRLRPVGQGIQTCYAGESRVITTVIDAYGDPLDGVYVQEIYTGLINQSGVHGPGQIYMNIYRGGGAQVQIVNEEGEPISAVSGGMSADWPSFHLIWKAGYCNCKPHPDAMSCEADLNNRAFLFAVGHYTYEVTFQRRY